MPLGTSIRWGIFIILSFLILSPIIKILRRTGYSEWWALLFYVPLVNIVALWLFAYGRWPKAGGSSSRPGLGGLPTS
ncbi:MAG TPA: hypothetical protein VF113_10840 [Stellaceae bacterium]